MTQNILSTCYICEFSRSVSALLHIDRLMAMVTLWLMAVAEPTETFGRLLKSALVSTFFGVYAYIVIN